MRKDLQKQLCEQERRGSGMGFRDHRKSKAHAIDEEFSAGRESMKKRYGYNTKDFSENFNPLWGVIRTNVNRPWDKVYSELCEVFDMRNHVNAHIVLHLFQFVETKTVFEDGVVYARRHDGVGPLEPLADSSREYFVHPKTGILLKNKFYRSHTQMYKERKQKELKEEEKLTKVISETLQLCRRAEDSPWFICTLAVIPPRVRTVDDDDVVTFSGGEAFDVWHKKTRGRVWSYGSPPADKYCVSFRTAGRRELKEYGVTN